MKIVSATVGPFPKSMFDLVMPEVTVKFEDGTEKVLFSFYPDELCFRAEEFVGLTEREARELRRRRDVAYLRS